MRVLLVCLGNICRSPTAEAALHEAAEQARLDLEIDSAGTGDWHVGDPPDERMRAAAAAVGLTLSGTARQIAAEDFDRFDLVLVMDRANYADVCALAPDEESKAKVALFRSFDPDADGEDVPDPYYGGDEGFPRVVEIVRAGARGVVAHLQSLEEEQESRPRS
ncbi:MAG TPA: low molecular weight protein-tyrosine-phosphatase [Egibacteraceae bacterium]|jgi:protein-tyrosine phosphatase|nr:low molecular weight protein-tyrosine-phosphatase [Egibacteraceae bacterium]